MKEIKTSKGKWQVVEINTYQEGQYYVDIIGSFHYKLSEITEEEASSIVECIITNSYSKEMLFMNYNYLDHPFNHPPLKAIQSLHSLLESQGIKITNNTYIFKV